LPAGALVAVVVTAAPWRLLVLLLFGTVVGLFASLAGLALVASLKKS
jgi:F0F1-type ATP synthase assembly protein I